MSGGSSLGAPTRRDQRDVKAVIPAAGLGTRLYPVTKVVPKELLPIGGRPAIQRVIEEAMLSGLTDFIILTRPDKPSIETYLKGPDPDDGPAFSGLRRLREKATLTFVEQQEPWGLGGGILQARPYVGDKAFAVLLPDNIIVGPRPGIAQLLTVHKTHKQSVLGLAWRREDEVGLYAPVATERLEERLHRIAEVAWPADPVLPGQLRGIGRYVFRPDIFEYLERRAAEGLSDFGEAAALRAYIEDHQLLGYELEGEVYHVGNWPEFVRAVTDFGVP